MASSTEYCVSDLPSSCSYTKHSRVLSALPALLFTLLCAALTCACVFQPRYAYAEDNTVEVIRTSNVIYYGNYQTTELQANGNIAYCAQPLKQLPANGAYSTQVASGDLKEAMWYSYGAPGFDARMWPETNYKGEAMTANDYYVASHVLLAYFYTGSAW